MQKLSERDHNQHYQTFNDRQVAALEGQAWEYQQLMDELRPNPIQVVENPDLLNTGSSLSLSNPDQRIDMHMD